jgi:hypothetical protein
MNGGPSDLYQNAILTTGTAWAVTFDNLQDQFLSGFAMEVYLKTDPDHRLLFMPTEFFLTRDARGTSKLQIRFADQSASPLSSTAKPIVHLHYPAP